MGKDLLKKILAVALSIGISFGLAGLLPGCGQKDPDNTQNPPAEEVIPEPEDNPTAPETPGTEIEEIKIEVEDIVDEYFGAKNFANEFNNALTSFVAKKVDIEKVKDIEVVSFEVKTNGKIVFNVLYDEGEEKESDTLTYEGDTTKFENFYKLSINSTSVINGVVAENGLTLDGEVVEDSQQHKDLKDDFTVLLATYNKELADFAEIPADDIVVYEEPKPIEYVTVQSIVDEYFKGMDFDSDIKQVMETIITTKTPIIDVKNNVALDFEIGQNGKINVIAECLNTRTTITALSCFAYTGDTIQYANFFNLIRDFDGTIAKILEGKGLTLGSNVDKLSTTVAELKAELSQLKTDYEAEKASFSSIDKSSILARTVIEPKYFTPEELATLGIQDTKAFAEAVLTNEKWQSQGVDPGWTMDDVVAVYVNNFGAEDIDKSSRANMVVVTKDGMFNHELCVRRYVGDATTDRHGMILQDNPNTWLGTTVKEIEFAKGSVVFDASGKSVKE